MKEKLVQQWSEFRQLLKIEVAQIQNFMNTNQLHQEIFESIQESKIYQPEKTRETSQL